MLSYVFRFVHFSPPDEAAVVFSHNRNVKYITKEQNICRFISKVSKSYCNLETGGESICLGAMSTRWYPIYKRGNPQLRVFMTDFWMKLVRNEQKPTPPPNVVTFQCSMEMTKHDIKNYLTKIYDIPVVDVRTEVRTGDFFQDPFKKYVKKKDDYRVAIVTMVRAFTTAIL